MILIQSSLYKTPHYYETVSCCELLWFPVGGRQPDDVTARALRISFVSLQVPSGRVPAAVYPAICKSTAKKMKEKDELQS
jgi:hypothetical protein